jgi:pyruvate formate lyase activating enzyme
MKSITRRQFLKGVVGGACVFTLSRIPLDPIWDDGQGQDAFAGVPELSRVEARYYQRLSNQEVECQLCPRRCRVGDLERGFCGVRENREGTYYTLVHSRPAALNVDPIEKKPFFHFLPSTLAFSLATAGCNIHCKFCQNWDISQVRPEQVQNSYLPPEAIVSEAQQAGCTSIAYTYSEPVIFYEYMIDIARLARRKGLKSVVVTNAFINPEPLTELCGQVDAVKVDLKAFTEKYYQEVCKGELKPVLESLKILKKQGIWYEIVYLTVPTLNDQEGAIRKMCHWIKNELSPHVPVHFTRFHPMYLLKNLPPTPVKSLERARQIALDAGLSFVYIGNVPGHEGENTYCPRCRKTLIRRVGYSIRENHLQKGACRYCGEKIPGVWG